MQVSVEKTSELSRKMTVHLPEELVQEKMEARLKTTAREVKLKGFRPGKVPRHLIKKMYGPKIRNEVMGELIQSSYFDALQDQNQRPVGPPNIVPGENAEEGNGFNYVAEFEVYPEISIDGLNNIEVIRQTAQITEDDLQDMIIKLREQKKKWRDTGQAAREKDRITINFSGTCEGENFTEGKVQDYQIVIGDEQMIPGFEDNLLGVEAGNNKTFELIFPEDYGNKDIAGKTAQFEVEVIKVEESLLPDVNADFMRDYGVENGDMELFRSEIKANMQRELDRAIRTNTKKAVMDQLFENIEITLPKILLDQEIENLKKPFKENAARQNHDVKAFDMPSTAFEAQARRRVALSLIMSEIILANDIKVDSERVRSTIEEIAQSYEQPEKLVNYYYGDEKRLAEVEQMVLEDQVVDWLLGQVKVKEESTGFETVMNHN